MSDLAQLHSGYLRRLLRLNEEIRQARKSHREVPELKAKRKKLNVVVSRLTNLKRDPTRASDTQLIESYKKDYMDDL